MVARQCWQAAKRAFQCQNHLRMSRRVYAGGYGHIPKAQIHLADKGVLGKSVVKHVILCGADTGDEQAVSGLRYGHSEGGGLQQDDLLLWRVLLLEMPEAGAYASPRFYYAHSGIVNCSKGGTSLQAQQ